MQKPRNSQPHWRHACRPAPVRLLAHLLLPPAALVPLQQHLALLGAHEIEVEGLVLGTRALETAKQLADSMVSKWEGRIMPHQAALDTIIDYRFHRYTCTIYRTYIYRDFECTLHPPLQHPISPPTSLQTKEQRLKAIRRLQKLSRTLLRP